MDLIIRQLVPELMEHGLLGLAVVCLGAALIMLWRKFHKHEKEDDKKFTGIEKALIEVSGSLKTVDKSLIIGGKKMDKIDSTVVQVGRELSELKGAFEASKE
jgi:hypothetical protein